MINQKLLLNLKQKTFYYILTDDSFIFSYIKDMCIFTIKRLIDDNNYHIKTYKLYVIEEKIISSNLQYKRNPYCGYHTRPFIRTGKVDVYKKDLYNNQFLKIGGMSGIFDNSNILVTKSYYSDKLFNEINETLFIERILKIIGGYVA